MVSTSGYDRAFALFGEGHRSTGTLGCLTVDGRWAECTLCVGPEVCREPDQAVCLDVWSCYDLRCGCIPHPLGVYTYEVGRCLSGTPN